MKKIILALSLGMFTMGFSQNYPYGNQNNNGWPDNGYGYYGDNEDRYYFPDDYYYEYPDDYYSDDYYESYYNDYRRSISMVNWNRFFYEFGLSNYQINMILDLNRQFSSYSIWNSYYRMNPNRWYYDRFYALERILGPRIFVIFQNRYYNGYSPVVYYTNYWRDYYRPRYRVAPIYRNININVYHVDRYAYHQNVGNQYGWNQPRNPHNPGGLREGDNSNPRNFGTLNQGNRSEVRSENSGIRNSAPRENGNIRNTPRTGGFENPRTQENSGNQFPDYGERNRGMRNASPRTEGGNFGNTRSEDGGFQNRESRGESGMRNSSPRMNSGGFQQRNESRGGATESRSSGRSGGMRFTSTP